jgi:ribosomal-protein-alanine N-acetyltransferase
VLRRCQALDVEEIYEVERKSFKPDDVYSVELLRFLCSYCGDHSYVYVADGKIIGYIITCIEGNAAHVISIATDPQYRRRGVGKLLLCTALSLLAKGEVQEVFLEVRVTNETALSLYRATGFEVVEVLKNYYSDGEDGYRLSLRDRKRAKEFCYSK